MSVCISIAWRSRKCYYEEIDSFRKHFQMDGIADPILPNSFAIQNILDQYP